MGIPLKYNLRNLLIRKTTTALTAFGIAMVILVFVALSALVYGLRYTIEQTGSADNVMVLSQSATSISSSSLDKNLIQEVKYLPEVKVSSSGEPLVSEELMVDENLYLEKLKDFFPTPVRGVNPIAFQVHDDVKIIQGQPPAPNGGVLVGRQVAAQFGKIAPGDQIKIGTRMWNVTGIFASNDNMLESEIWADLNDLTAHTKKKTISVIVFKVSDPNSISGLLRQLNDSPRVNASAVSETGYFHQQTGDARNLWLLTVIVSVVLGIAAIFGGMNTMYAAVANRLHEIGILQALGFSPRSILFSFVIEGIIIASMGGGLACLIATALNGVSIKTQAANRFLDFNLHVTPTVLLGGMALSILIGVVGGFFPARKAAKLEVIQAMRSR
ncbi:MAG TPA: ABC transporter permease [Blastocatellia bacterium]|jgi:ABC-type lipoprotein release transport system permease subunit